MDYCKRCLYPANHPLYIIIDEQGVCSGCRTHEEKDRLDWGLREKKLIRLLKQYQNRNGTYYDCIIPVSGSGDDFFVVDQIKFKYGMNPLLITYNIHYNTKIGVRNLARLITKTDCDHIMFTVSPKTVKKVIRETIKQIGDIYWHITAGIQAFAVTVSKRFNIPLIIWGVNGWLDQVGQFSHEDSVEMTKKVWKEHSLRGRSPMDLVNEDSGLTTKMMKAFMYPEDNELEQSRTRGIYLGNFIRWDSQKQIEGMIEKYNFETTIEQRTFNKYETIGCFHNAGVHDYIKYLKFGYGKVTDHASRDIRLKRMTREEGAALVSKYQHKKPDDLVLLLKWLDMDEDEFIKMIDVHRDPRIWEKDDKGQWAANDNVFNHLNEPGIEEVKLKGPLDRRLYQQTTLLEPPEEDNEYILMGRSYMDEFDFKAIEG
jgi:N-acetyl sugar amidotransferase